MTYTEIHDELFGRHEPSPFGFPRVDQRAWNVIRGLLQRKGFNHWWEPLSDELKNEIFEEIKHEIGRTYGQTNSEDSAFLQL